MELFKEGRQKLVYVLKIPSQDFPQPIFLLLYEEKYATMELEDTDKFEMWRILL